MHLKISNKNTRSEKSETNEFKFNKTTSNIFLKKLSEILLTSNFFCNFLKVERLKNIFITWSTKKAGKWEWRRTKRTWPAAATTAVIMSCYWRWRGGKVIGRRRAWQQIVTRLPFNLITRRRRLNSSCYAICLIAKSFINWALECEIKWNGWD